MTNETNRLMQLLKLAPGMKMSIDEAKELCTLLLYAEKEVKEWIEKEKIKNSAKKVQFAKDLYDEDERVTIIAEGPFQDLKGTVVFASDNSLDIEVAISYKGYKDCESYFKGTTCDIQKVDYIKTKIGEESSGKTYDYAEDEHGDLWELYYESVNGKWEITGCRNSRIGGILMHLPKNVTYLLSEKDQ